MIEHLSYSSISKYLQCGRQWRYHYVDKIETGKSDALLFGSAWHNFLNLVGGAGGFDGVKMWDYSLTALDKKTGNPKFDGMASELIDLGKRMIASPSVLDYLHGINFINFWKMEQYFELQVPGVPVPTVGYVDAIRQDKRVFAGRELIITHVPVDFKTASRKWTQDKADKDLQATMYIAMMHQAGLIAELPAKFEFHIFTKTKNPEVQILETWRDSQDIIGLYNLIGIVWDAIEQGVYVPNPTSWSCNQKYCDFWDRCKGGAIDVRD